MKLHRNIAIQLALVVAGLILVFYLLSTSVLLNEFTQIDHREADQRMEGVNAAFISEIQGLEDITKDWASWDDSYEFMKNGSSAYISSNLVDGTFINNRLDILLYFNRSGMLSYGKSFDYQKTESRILSGETIASLSTYGLVPAILQNETGQSGLVNLPDGILILSAMPILTSSNQGPAQGVLIMGRYLTGGVIARFEALSSVSLTMMDPGSAPKAVEDAYSTLPSEHPYLIIPVNETLQEGYLFIEDLHGSPGAIFRVTMARDFFLEGTALTRYFFTLLIVVALIFGTIMMFVLEKNVLSRLSTLNRGVIMVRKSGNLDIQIPEEGDDEIASFAREINRMFTALKEAEKAINAQNHQLTVVNEIVSIVSRAETLDGVYDLFLRKTIDMLGFNIGAIFILNLQSRQAELKGYTGIPSENVPELLSAAGVLDIHLSPHEQVFTTAIPVYYEGIPGNMPEPEKISILDFLGIQSLAVIPLSAGSVVLGAMYIGRTGPHRFSEYERGILTSIGKEVGNALFKGVLQDKLVAAMTRAEINHEQAQKAKDEANFYLDIITHDINNVNQTALGYIMLLSDPAEGTRGDLVGKLESTIIKSSDIIHDVSVIRRIREKEASRKEIDLDAVIRETIHHFSDAHIAYHGLPVAVSADELIPEIFLNLIGNSLKFGGPDTDIAIAVEKKGEEVEVTVQDTGPGIPYALKPVLFRKFQRGSTSMSGKGLGLYIVRMLVERYGGRVWVDDAVPGQPESGAAIKFTLRRSL